MGGQTMQNFFQNSNIIVVYYDNAPASTKNTKSTIPILYSMYKNNGCGQTRDLELIVDNNSYWCGAK